MPCAFVPSRSSPACATATSWKQGLGAWPLSHWAPCLGQSQYLMSGEEELCSFEIQFPEGAVLGRRK